MNAVASDSPYVVGYLHSHVHPPKGFKTLGSALGSLIKDLKNRRNWATKFAGDSIQPITDLIGEVDSVSALEIGQSVTFDAVIDEYTNTRFYATVTRGS